MTRKSMFTQIGLLAAAQALFQTVSVLVMTVGALAGGAIASDPSLATAPIAAMFLGTATFMIPASLWMAKVGRRAGFLAGSALGVAAGLVAAWGVGAGSLALLCLGTFLVGAYQAFAQFYRFAASEVADDAFRPRAISLVLAGGIVAALLGPMLGRAGGPLLATAYQGSFLILSAVSAIAFVVLLALRVPPLPVHAGGGRVLSEIVAQPTYLVALFSAATGYGIMILAMTATPLAMQSHHHDMAAAAHVIQLHVLGMFLPSFFTGSLIARFGVLRVMLAGVALLSTHVLVALSGTTFPSFASALVLLGVGWNFLYVGGTTLLTRTYAPEERGRAQATNDFAIFAIGLLCSFSAGPLLVRFGWQTMNTLLLPWLAVAALVILWHMRQGSVAVAVR